MPIVEYLNFDSVNASKTSNDSFDATFTFVTKFTNINKIYLKNIEIPIGFPNIRSSNESNTLNFIMNGVNYSASVTQSNYLSISSLLTALNASIVTALTSSGFTMVLSVNNNVVSIVTTGAFSSYSITPNTLSNILGISSAQNLNAGTYNSIFLANIGYDTYLQICFYNIPSKFSTLGNVPSALKIPMNTNAYNILFYSTDRGDYDQCLTIQDHNYILSQMRVIIYDRYGFPVNNGNLDYSFTLAIEYDEKNI